MSGKKPQFYIFCVIRESCSLLVFYLRCGSVSGRLLTSELCDDNHLYRMKCHCFTAPGLSCGDGLYFDLTGHCITRTKLSICLM